MDLEAQDIELTYRFHADNDCTVMADAEQLKRVVNNIVSNSIKYIDKPKGYINIRVKDVGDFVQVEIEDNGKGIATKDLPLIFNRFYRVPSSGKKHNGSGIGLAIVKRIAQFHHGRVFVNSRPGEGASFHLELPL